VFSFDFAARKNLLGYVGFMSVFSEKKEQYDVIEINYSDEHSLQKY
jgi:hypothetical protein